MKDFIISLTITISSLAAGIQPCQVAVLVAMMQMPSLQVTQQPQQQQQEEEQEW